MNFLLTLTLFVGSLLPVLSKTGPILVEEQGFLLTGMKWMLVTELDLEPYFDIMDRLQEQQNTLELQSKELTNLNISDTFLDISTVIHQGVSFLKTDMSLTRQSLTDIEQSLVPTRPRGKNRAVRTKRGLINVVGMGLKALFGTADSDDIKTINHKISQIQMGQEKVYHVIKEQFSIVQGNWQAIGKNRYMLKKITRVSELIYEHIQTLSEIVNAISYAEQENARAIITLYNVVKVQSSFQTLEIALSQFRDNLNSLLNGIELLSQLKISPYFLTPSQLFTILSDLQPRLPDGVNFVLPISSDNIYQYYALLTVTSATVGSKLMLYIHVPLRANENYFKLYKIIPLLSRVPHANFSIQIKPPNTHLAVSADQQRYMELSVEDLSSCSTTTFRLCEPMKAIVKATTMSCAYALFRNLESAIHETCDRRMVPSSIFQFYRLSKSQQWAYSIPKPITLALKCLNKDLRTINLNYTGILEVEKGCSLHGERIDIPAQYESISTISLSSPNIRIPSVSPLTKTENTLITNRDTLQLDEEADNLFLELNAKINEGLPEQGIRLQTFAEHLKEINEKTPTAVWSEGFMSPFTQNLLTLLLMISLVVMVGYALKVKCAAKCRKKCTNVMRQALLRQERERMRGTAPLELLSTLNVKKEPKVHRESKEDEGEEAETSLVEPPYIQPSEPPRPVARQLMF
jgi:hypothetical protein